MSNIGTSDWSTSAASNNAAPPDGWPEGQAPSTVNNCAREGMAAVKKWFLDTNGSVTTTGTGTAYIVTTNSSHAALSAQPLIVAEIHTDNTAAATLNVDSLGAKSVKMPDGGDIAAGDLQAGAIAIFAYESDADVYVLIAGANLGTAAALDTGTASGNVPVLGAGGALDGAIRSVPVGTVQAYIGATAPTGWLMYNGDSIGSAASAATQASDDYETLFELFWDSMADAQAAVSTGRGATAAADWAANKTLTMPDPRGRAIIGTGTGADPQSLTARTHGTAGGAEEHTLTQAQLPNVRLNTFTTQETSDPSPTALTGSLAPTRSNTDTANTGYTMNGSSSEPTAGRTSALGSGNAHANMQPWHALNWIVRY